MKKTFANRSLRGLVAALTMVLGMFFASTETAAQSLQPAGVQQLLVMPTGGNLVDQNLAKDRLNVLIADQKNLIVDPTIASLPRTKAFYYSEAVRLIEEGHSVGTAIFAGARQTTAFINPAEGIMDLSARSTAQQLLNELYTQLQ